MTKTIWKTYNGIDVVIDDGGDFCATVGEVLLRESCWAHLRKKIEDESKSKAQALKIRLQCVVLLRDERENYEVRCRFIVGLNRNDESFKLDPPTDKKEVYVVLPATLENERLLEQLAIAKSTVRDVEAAIKDRTVHQHNWGNRIEASKYDNKLRDLQDLYARCMKASAPLASLEKQA